MAENTRSPRMKCSFRTIPRLHEIRSVVENVSKLPLDIKVTGPEFYLVPECPCSIAFEKDQMYLRVNICNPSDVEVEIVRTIILYDCNFEKLHVERENVCTIFKNDDTDVIGNVKNRSAYDTLTNDTLIIDLSITINGIMPIQERKHRFMKAENPGRKLMEDMKMMLKNPVNSDVYLYVEGLDERFPVHWSVLCSRCPYFKKMFDTEMVDGIKNSVTVDLPLSALANLIDFLYTADFKEEITLQELFDLYKAAEKYELMDLLTLCAYRIMLHATPANACQILQFAHKHNDNALRIEAMDFIRLNSEIVYATEGWKSFKESEPLSAFVFSFRFKPL